MTSAFLLDENLPAWWRGAINNDRPHLSVWRVGDPGAPPIQSPDPDILRWCEANNFILLTNNRGTMPGHLADHLAAGRHVPGIVVVSLGVDVHFLAELLDLIASASFPGEFEDQIRYLTSL
jgi:Domain of unknown function (DUF5615)